MARQPKSENVPFLLRLPPDLYACLREKAEEETRSINGEIVHMLRQMVTRDSGWSNQTNHQPGTTSTTGS